VIEMAGMLRVPMRRGALAGVLLVLLGAWGGLIAFIGPYSHYAYAPDRAWSYTTGRRQARTPGRSRRLPASAMRWGRGHQPLGPAWV
jgi:hypothetical protein